MPYLTKEQIQERKKAGVRMNRLNCGWHLSTETLANIAIMLDRWEPKTQVEKRDKKICYLAFIKNMNATQIARLNDPLLVGTGNRSKGQPLSVTSILKICYKYVPEAKERSTNRVKTAKSRNELLRERHKGEIKKPFICCTCGSRKDLELHHIIPLAVGGTNDYYNLIYLCHNCHMKLHHKIYDNLKQWEELRN